MALTIMLSSLSRAIRALQLSELMIVFIFTLIPRLLKAEVAKLQPLQQHCRIIRYTSLSINLASGLSFPIYYSLFPCHGSSKVPENKYTTFKMDIYFLFTKKFRSYSLKSKVR